MSIGVRLVNGRAEAARRLRPRETLHLRVAREEPGGGRRRREEGGKQLRRHARGARCWRNLLERGGREWPD